MNDRSPSRREFLRLAGHGAAGIALLGVFPACEGFNLEQEGEASPFQFITPQHAPDWYWFSGLGYEKPYAPRIDPAAWSMDIRSGGKSVGAVTYRKLKALEADGKSIAYLKTMRCIFGSFANTVPGTLTATGIFRGIPLRTVLEDTSISGEVTKLRFESADGFRTSLSYDRVHDDSLLPVLLAYELNGERHRFRGSNSWLSRPSADCPGARSRAPARRRRPRHPDKRARRAPARPPHAA